MKINFILLLSATMALSGFSYKPHSAESNKLSNEQPCPIKFVLVTNTTISTLSITGSAGFFFTINNPSSTVPPNLLTSVANTTSINVDLTLPAVHPAVRFRISCNGVSVYCVNVPANALITDVDFLTGLCCNGTYTISVQAGVTCP